MLGPKATQEVAGAAHLDHVGEQGGGAVQELGELVNLGQQACTGRRGTGWRAERQLFRERASPLMAQQPLVPLMARPLCDEGWDELAADSQQQAPSGNTRWYVGYCCLNQKEGRGASKE